MCVSVRCCVGQEDLPVLAGPSGILSLTFLPLHQPRGLPKRDHVQGQWDFRFLLCTVRALRAGLLERDSRAHSRPARPNRLWGPGQEHQRRPHYNMAIHLKLHIKLTNLNKMCSALH